MHMYTTLANVRVHYTSTCTCTLYTSTCNYTEYKLQLHVCTCIFNERTSKTFVH